MIRFHNNSSLRAVGTRLILGLVTLAFLASGAARLLIETSPSASADALLVFAGAPVYLQRVNHAAALYASGRARRILLTDDGSRRRWSRPLQRNPRSIELAISALRQAGVPENQITVLAGPFRGTNEEAFAAVEYSKHHGIRSILAVTSPFHSRRAAWSLRTFARGDTLSVASDPVPIGIDSPTPWTWWLTSVGWRTVAPEFIKLPYYWFRFGVLPWKPPLTASNARYTDERSGQPVNHHLANAQTES